MGEEMRLARESFPEQRTDQEDDSCSEGTAFYAARSGDMRISNQRLKRDIL